MASSAFYFNKLSKNAYRPEKMIEISAGFDLRIVYDYIVKLHDNGIIKTDLAVKIPDGCYDRFATRSGLTLRISH